MIIEPAVMIQQWLMHDGVAIAVAYEQNAIWIITELVHDSSGRKPFTVTAPTRELAERAFLAVWG